ncbi:MAG: chromosome segregation protein SMC [Clostridia bacterium]|nr:chromosome segregation protein SMC [Clostridia bacterium]
MYLKRLEMQGFKSFADKTVLEFMPGITSVIGPNGSGKSNIADAIRWVLGEQSIKELRGGKSADIIFAGTQSRKSLGFAEASLVFDNMDGKLPIEYQEVSVTRRIYRSGETGYFINKVQCRLKDILELFMDTGIGKDGYSIIGQGKIDEILSNKSEDRRNVFEEAAGIVKFKTRKEESEKKLERTKLNVLRINDIISEIEGNLEPLKIQSEKAKKYVDLKSELKNIEVGLFVHNIERFKSDLEKTVQDATIIQENCDLEEAKLEKIKIIKEDLKSTIDELTENIEKTQNLGFSSQKEIEMLNSDINVSKTKIQNNEENKKRFKQEIEEIKQKIEKSTQDMELKLSRKDGLKENKEKFEKELEEKTKKLEEINKTLSEKELEIEEDKRKLEENIDTKYEIEGFINEQKVNISNIEKRLTQIQNEISNSISELDNTRFTKEELEKGFYEVQKQKNEKQKELEKLKEKNNTINEKIKTIDIKLNNSIQELNFKESKYKFLVETEKEKDGFQRSVKTLLKDCEKIKELGKGVRGAIAELIDVPENIETAIEMALGASMQNVVTDNEQDAKRLIEHLRNNNLGRASFLPISNVKGKKLDKIKGNNKGVLGIASDLIKYDKKYEGVILNLLGKTVIAENMDIGIALAKENGYSFRIVTLDGDIITTTGALSGGSVSKKTVNILGRSKQIENLAKEIEQIKANQGKLKKEKEDILKSSEDFLKTVQEMENALQTIEIKYNVENEKINTVNQSIQRISNTLEKLKLEKQESENKKDEYLKTIEQENVKKIALDEENTNLKEKITQFSDSNKDKQKEVDDLNFDITNLKISVSSFNESENSIDEMTELLKQEIENQTNNIENKKQQIEKMSAEQVELENTIKQDEKKIEEIKDKVNRSDSDIEKMKQERIKSNEKLSQKEKEEVDEFKIIEDLKSQIVKLEVKKTKLDEDLNNVITALWNEYELTPNACEDYQKPENIALTTRRVNSLRQDIRELGSVNVDSIEEYKNLKQRYEFMCEQRLDLENTSSKLRKIIAEITENMREQFKEKFKIINENFGQTFKELFGGGEAKVVLQDESNILECGIDIIAQPPGKKLQSMALLSGGERAFTAIALLFAILKMNPAPFCVLDEIEAALDDINVNRYAEFLKKFAKGTQFLVITHRKGTMEAADTVYGVTMEEKGISKLLSMKLK